MKNLVKLAAAVGVGICVLTGPSSASAEMTAEDVERIVRDLLLKNPKLVEDALKSARSRPAGPEQLAAVRAAHDELAAAPGYPNVGAPAGDVVIVEFFDYACPYCALGAKAVRQVVAEDAGVRVVYKQFPILGPASELAARVSLAAWDADPGRFEGLHDRMLGAKGQLGEDRLAKFADEAGYKGTELVAGAKAGGKGSPGNGGRIGKAKALAGRLGISGTPVYVLLGPASPRQGPGVRIAVGALKVEQLRSYIEEVRGSASGRAAAKPQ